MYILRNLHVCVCIMIRCSITVTNQIRIGTVVLRDERGDIILHGQSLALRQEAENLEESLVESRHGDENMRMIVATILILSSKLRERETGGKRERWGGVGEGELRRWEREEKRGRGRESE